jgi:hypothetical protein
MTPATPRLDHLLEHGKAFERDADGALDTIQVHQGQRLLAEEGAIHAGFKHDVGEGGTDAVEVVHHEVMGPLAVMDIAGAVKDVEKLSRLSHGGKQVVVTARALLLGVVSDGGALGMSLRGHNRAIESRVKRANCSRCMPSITSAEESWRTCPTLLRSTVASVREMVATSGRRRWF